MAGQTLNDRLTAARHALAGQGLARIVCKATTEEVIGPKKKHLDYLLHCTNEPNVSIPQLANLLIERTQHASWVVVFKALVTVHHLMCYGNERFTQYLASSNCTFQLSNFLDKQGYDMSTFIRRYAKYLNEKAMSYRTVAFDFCKAKRGKEDGTLRTMPTDKLLKALPTLQQQLDALLEFDCTSNDLTNGVINSCFMLLFRDLIRLFACYNDGIINLLEKFFDMNKKSCREALDIYKKFLIRMDRVAELLKVAENVGIDKGDIPDLTKAPSSLLDALEQHLAALEGKKGAPAGASNAANNTQEVNGAKTQEFLRKAVEEEAAAMSQMKSGRDSPLSWDQPSWSSWEQRLKEKTSDSTSPPSSKTNPFLASPAAPPDQSGGGGILDLFSSSPPQSGGLPASSNNDLLCLAGGNPFADSLFGAPPPPAAPATFVTFGATPGATTNGLGAAPIVPTPTNSAAGTTFGTEVNFAAAFGNEAAGTEEGGGAAKVGLTLPVTEHPFPPGRSASPSPTAELMRGAGTTPILAHHPDLGFGEMSDSIEEPSTASMTTSGGGADLAAWGGAVNKQEDSGAAFDQAPWPVDQPSAAAVTVPEVDLFGLGGEFEDVNKNKPPRGVAVGNIAPPPSPFGGLELGMATATSTVQQAATAMTTGPKTAVDDLNIAIQMAMQPKTDYMPPSSSSSSLSKENFGAIGGSPAAGFDNFGDLLQPQATGPAAAVVAAGKPPATGAAPPPTQDVLGTSKGSLIKGDLDSSLASLCQNLDINGPNQSIKKTSGHQWGSPKTSGRTGGQGWAPPAATPPTAAWGAPAPAFQPAAAPQWGAQAPAPRGMMPPMMGQAPFGVMGAPMRPPQMGMAQPPMGMAQPPAMFPGTNPPPPSSTVNDPFGAL